MLRVGLTGGLGSGKSTVGAMLRALGAHVIESDEIGRSIMEPGHVVYQQIVNVFGSQVLTPEGRLNRPQLAEAAFQGGRIKELNAIVHPAVIEAQREWMDQLFTHDPSAVAVIISALIFEVERDAREGGAPISAYADLRKRIDRIVLVTASDDAKIARYLTRLSPPPSDRSRAEADARSRLAHQISDSEKVPRADYVIENCGDLQSLRAQVEQIWPRLKQESNLKLKDESLK